MRVNFVQDLAVLKMLEDRKKREEDKKAKAAEADRQPKFLPPKPVEQNINRSTDLKDIFFKKNKNLSSSSSIPSARSVSANNNNTSKPAQKKPIFNISNFKPMNSIPTATQTPQQSESQQQQSQNITVNTSVEPSIHQQHINHVPTKQQMEVEVSADMREKPITIQKKEQTHVSTTSTTFSTPTPPIVPPQSQKQTSAVIPKMSKQNEESSAPTTQNITNNEVAENLSTNPTTEAAEIPGKKPRKTTTKVKKPYELKKTKEENLVRQDLRGKWRERYKGGVNALKMRFTKNGKLKQTFRKKYDEHSAQDKQSAFDNIQTTNVRTNDTKSQFYERTQKQNMYMNCLSDGLMVTLEEALENPVLRSNENSTASEFSQLDFSDQSDANLRRVLQVVYGFTDFRSGQLTAIRSILTKQSTLVVQSTGHGKSLIYQFPTLFMPGMAIVISPLISLMMDQVKKLPKHIRGAAYNSVLTWEQKQKIIQLIKDGEVNLLYISPEVLQSDFFYFFKSLPLISYVCIDEAHCVSEWSHNFRTSYLIINDLIQQKLKCEQIVALTATATKQTQLSMTKKLKISNVIRGISVDRPNLKISITRDKDRNASVFKLLNSLPLIQKNSIIIYCKYKYQCDTLAQFLTYSGIISASYHSGCEEKRKAQIYDDFMSGEIQVVVATIAFGMGIDKPDIRAVIHMNMPKTIENYVQEAGRAGRDGNTAYCHLFLDDEDFYRECGYVQGDALDYPLLKMFYEKMLSAIKNIEDETRTVRKKKGAKDSKESAFDAELLEKAQGKFCYIELKPTMLAVDSKRESLQTLLMKMEQFQDQSNPIFKVFPVGFRNCSIKFYRENAESVQRGKEFLKTIMEMSIETNGCHTFNVCDVCNRLSIDPLDLQRQLKELGKQGMNYEMKDESLIFQLIRPFTQDEASELLDKVYAEVKTYEDTQLNKIHFIYAVAKMSSYPSIDYMLKNQLFVEGTKLVSMSKYFDEYFDFESSQYVKILENASINLAQILPFEPLQSEDRDRIITDVSSFLRSEVIEKNIDEEQQADLLDQYRNAKVIARIFQGIPSYTFELKEWKNNRFWDRYYQFRHAELYEVVEQGISDFLFDATLLPKRAIKRLS